MEYFAAKPTAEIGDELVARVESYNEYLLESGLLTELRKSYRTYYGESAITDVGVSGELKRMQVNNYANLIRHIHHMVTSQRPAFEPRAANTDYASQSQTVLAQGLLDYYLREKRLERSLKLSAELALFMREGWISCTWNPAAGEMYGVNPESQAPVYEGDLLYKVHRLPDVIRDVRKQDADFNWLIVRDYKNKWDLAAKYPDQAERITSMTEENDDLLKYRIHSRADDGQDSDDIPVFSFFHRKSEAVPMGRQVDFLADGTVLIDGPLAYRRVPLYRITASEMVETAFGHSPAFDLLPLQDALDSAFSTVLTNQNAFGVQNIMSPKGGGLSVTQISGGLNLIEYDQALGPPAPLNLTQTPPEIFNFINILNQYAESISGVNSVARGNASPQLSGAAMALLQSTALQFSAGVQQSYTQLIEDVGSATLQTLIDFAQVPRVAHIVGKHNRSLMRAFKGEDIKYVTRVTVDSGNALSKTTAGRVEIANQLLNAGMIKRPEQYLLVLQTGQLEPMIESDTSVLLRIRAENERLAEGQPVKAIITDPHDLDIREHLSVLDSPEARENPEIVANVLAHVQEHIELAKTMPPELLQILGRQPVGPPPPMPGSAEGIPSVVDAAMPVTAQAASVQGPRPPVDPMTGQPMLASGPQPQS